MYSLILQNINLQNMEGFAEYYCTILLSYFDSISVN